MLGHNVFKYAMVYDKTSCYEYVLVCYRLVQYVVLYKVKNYIMEEPDFESSVTGRFANVTDLQQVSNCCIIFVKQIFASNGKIAP